MSFARGSGLAGTSTPQQPPPQRPSLYPSLAPQTPATPTPSSAQQQHPSFLLAQKPPPRPASAPLSFGSLSHSTSAPSLSSAFQNDPLTNTGSNQFGGSSFAAQHPTSGSGFPSPAPQPPLTTFDLSGNSLFQNKPSPSGPGWGGGGGGGALGGHSLTRSHSQQLLPQANPLAERRYLPSHLRSYSPERSSPLAKDAVSRDPNPSPQDKRRVSFGSVTTFGHPSTSNFGGAGFGTPKDEGKSKVRPLEDDLPPSLSIYDQARSSPFSKQETPQLPSPPPDISSSIFTSIPTTTVPTKGTRPDPTPVILFGFPPSHAPLIIREYERYGPIQEHVFSASPLPQSSPESSSTESTLDIQTGGNWIRITYADAVSAARAVATNGQIFGGAYMIGVMYAPKPDGSGPPETVSPVVTEEEPSRTPGGERRMNVVRGGKSMFMNKKDVKKPGSEGGPTPVTDQWGTWAWNQVFGAGGEQKGQQGQVVGRPGVDGGTVVAAGGGQSNVVVRALRAVSETVFGF